MSVIFIVLPLALLIALVAVVAFMRSARAGQFDDLDTPSVRMLLDDPPVEPAGDEAEVASTRKPTRNT